MTTAPRPGTAAGLRVLAQHDLGGYGDGMQVLREGDTLYVGHMGTSGIGTSILDVADPARPVLVTQWPAPPGTHNHKVQAADRLLLVNHEKFLYRAAAGAPFSAGLAVYRLDDPVEPEQVAFWPSGGRGVHRIVWTGGRYAHMSAIPDHFRDRIWVVVDLADPQQPVEAGRWWWPGQRDDEHPQWPDSDRHAAHHALLDGDRAYLGYDDAGMVVLDVSDITHPRQVGHLQWAGGSTHTCLPLPGRKLVVVTDEQVADGPHAPQRAIRVVDVSGASPQVMAVCPHPDGFDRDLLQRWRARLRSRRRRAPGGGRALGTRGAAGPARRPDQRPVRRRRRADLGHRPDRRRPLRPGTRAGPGRADGAVAHLTASSQRVVVAALTPAQKSSTTGGGAGDVTWRCVSRIPVTPLRGLERHVVPVPPSQPPAPGGPRAPAPMCCRATAHLAGT